MPWWKRGNKNFQFQAVSTASHHSNLGSCFTMEIGTPLFPTYVLAGTCRTQFGLLPCETEIAWIFFFHKNAVFLLRKAAATDNFFFMFHIGSGNFQEKKESIFKTLV